MSKLLKANFSRLWHDRTFRLLTAVTALIGISMAAVNAINIRREGAVWTMDFSLLIYVTVVPVLSSVLTALFIGSDYSCGTLRNKIISGHHRGSIYLADLVVCCCAAIFLCVVFVLAMGVPGLLLGGKLQSAPAKLLLYGGLSLALMIAFTALFTLVAMLCQNKAHTTAGCILLAFILLFIGVYITSALNEPEYLAGYSYTENGVTVEEPEMRNPNYISGTTRKVYEFLQDFTPGGQVMQISNMETEAPTVLAMYDGIILLAATGCGMIFFRKKDLR